MMGSGGMVVTDSGTCMVAFAKFFLGFTQHESCGKCIPCREGTKRMLEILERITDGKGEMKDLPELQHLARAISRTSACGLGQSAPNPVVSTLRYFEHELHFPHPRPALPGRGLQIAGHLPHSRQLPWLHPVCAQLSPHLHQR